MLRLCPSYLPDFCLRNGFQGPSPSKGLRWGWTTSYFTGSPSRPWRLKWNLLSSSAQESLPASMTSQRQLGMASRWHSQLHQHPWVHPISLLKCSLVWSSSTETESFLPHTCCFSGGKQLLIFAKVFIHSDNKSIYPALSKVSLGVVHTMLSFNAALSFFLMVSLVLSIGSQKLTWK